MTDARYHSGMQKVRVPIVKIGSSLTTLPEYFSAGASGLDLSAAIEEPLTIAPGSTALVPCGFALALPEGFEGQVRPRSGLASKHAVTVLNAPGTIDADYRGEVKVLLINHGREPFVVTSGLRIAQLVVAPVARVEWAPGDALPESIRGEGGFGHTGT
jgi:dUTP pyrophosphatase